jgi:hypothetical protein
MSGADDAERWLTQAQFARAEGCDEKQVRRGLASGKLVARYDGKLDRAQIDSGWRRPRRDSKDADISESRRTNVRPHVRADEAATTARAHPSKPTADMRGPSDAVAGALVAQLATRRAPERMQVRDVRSILSALDWSLPFAWSDEMEARRAREAAQALVWEAASSEERDDGHWGGFQLRARPAGDPSPVMRWQIEGGFGYELEPFEVLRLCRSFVCDLVDEDGDLWQDLDDEVTVIPALLPALALPHLETERPPPRVDAENTAGANLKLAS